MAKARTIQEDLENYIYNNFDYSKYNKGLTSFLYDLAGKRLQNASPYLISLSGEIGTLPKLCVEDTWVWNGLYNMEIALDNNLQDDKFGDLLVRTPVYPETYDRLEFSEGPLTNVGYEHRILSETDFNNQNLFVKTSSDTRLVDLYISNGQIVDSISGNALTISDTPGTIKNVINTTTNSFDLLYGCSDKPAAYIKLSLLPKLCEFIENCTYNDLISIVTKIGAAAGGTGVSEMSCNSNIVGLWRGNDDMTNIQSRLQLLNLYLTDSEVTTAFFGQSDYIDVATTFRYDGQLYNNLLLMYRNNSKIFEKNNYYNNYQSKRLNTSIIFNSNQYAREIDRYNSWLVIGGEGPSMTTHGCQNLSIKRVTIYGHGSEMLNNENTVLDFNFDTDTPYDIISKNKMQVTRFNTTTLNYALWDQIVRGTECISDSNYDGYHWDTDKMRKLKYFLNNWNPTLSYKVTIDWNLRNATEVSQDINPILFHHADGTESSIWPCYLYTGEALTLSGNASVMFRTIYSYDADKRIEYYSVYKNTGLITSLELPATMNTILLEGSEIDKLYLFKSLSGINTRHIVKRFSIERTSMCMDPEAFKYMDDILTFYAVEDSTVSYTRRSTEEIINDTIFVYRTYNPDTLSWSGWLDWTMNTPVQLTSDMAMQVLSTQRYAHFSDRDTITSFVMTGRIKASGNVGSLLSKNFRNNGSSGIHGITFLSPYEFAELFKGCTALESAPDLPNVLTAGVCSYKLMFQGCTNLKYAMMDIPNTIFGISSCTNMFALCISLQLPPKIHATEVGQGSCEYMFDGCTQLNIPDTTYILPTKLLRLVEDCYYAMFRNCTSLVRTPILPAKSLNTACYGLMFKGCTNLKYVHACFENADYIPSGTTDWLADIDATTTNRYFCASMSQGWASSYSSAIVQYDSSGLVIKGSASTIPVGWYYKTSDNLGYYNEY